MKIRDVMTPEPRTVSPDDTIQTAARIMRDEDTGAVPVVNEGRVVAMVTREASDLMSSRQIRRLPVVENHVLVGIVSLGDLAVKEGKDSRIGETLEQISEPAKAEASAASKVPQDSLR
jgi:CBS domain-containing protein